MLCDLSSPAADASSYCRIIFGIAKAKLPAGCILPVVFAGEANQFAGDG
jgi:hypothetical protein